MKEVMMALKLVGENDDILKRKCDIIDFKNNNINLHDISTEMLDVMFNHGGVGLAAPQVGMAMKIFVMVIDGEFFTCINPEIIVEGLDIEVESEGCLSFPKLYLKIKRPTNISVKYYDVNGKCIIDDMNGIIARIFLHEMDHLNGITFDAKSSKLRLRMAKRKRIKLNNTKQNRKGIL